MSADFVQVELVGGLGNQMFQYACARAIADRHACECVLDISGYSRDRKRSYELWRYPIRARISPARMPNIRSRMLSRVAALWGPGAQPPVAAVREHSFRFDAALSASRPPIVIQGYFQSEKYFLDSRDEITSDLCLPQSTLRAISRQLAELRASNSVSIHVRRGDYVSDPTVNAFHGTCSLDYYRQAIEYINARVKQPQYYVFSDDIGWARDHIRTGHPTTFAPGEDNPDPAIDLALMSACHHNILANSSFSWWAGWLNSYCEKIVVAPKRWFSADVHDTADLCPDEWILL